MLYPRILNTKAMNNIHIWAAKPSGNDPTTHFWFERDGVRYRICDGALWTERQECNNIPDFPVPCSLCKETYLEDVLRGKKLLHLLTEPPEPLFAVETALDIRHDPNNNGVYPHEFVVCAIQSQWVPHQNMEVEGGIVPRVPIGSFARFYEARPAGQVRIVRDIRTRLLDPEGYKNRDYYHWLRNGIRKTHWSTNEIKTFRDGLALFLEETREDKRKHYKVICESYIDFWIDRAASYFRIKPVSVEMEGLTILVTPEVGMRIGDDSYALKIWLNARPPTRPARQVVHYMMDRVVRVCSDWRDDWHLGIWDIRRKNILPPVRTARDFELGLRSQAAAFLHIWNDLDEQSENFGE